MSELNGFGKVFAFTFFRHAGSTGFKCATIILAALCLLAPAVIMAVTELLDKNPEETPLPNIGYVYYVDESRSETAELGFLNAVGGGAFSDVSYRLCASLEAALFSAGETQNSLVLVIGESEGEYSLDVLLPHNTGLTQGDAESFAGFFSSHFSRVLMQKSGIEADLAAELLTPVSIVSGAGSEETVRDGGQTGIDGVKRVLSVLLPYLNVMALYFMVLIYGQSVANSVIMEKTSKLIDTLLVCIKPGAMVLGKLFAIALAGTMQMAVWLLSLAGGFAAGTLVVRAINPHTDMALILLFEQFGRLSGMFTVQGAVLAALMLVAGFLLYLSLGAIGGAMAGKPEDLSSTNIFFVLVLVVSFLCSLLASQGRFGELPMLLLRWIPFTSVLIMPSLTLLGEVSAAAALGAVAVSAAVSVVLTILAGKIYKALLLYKGSPPGIGKAIAMVRRERTR